MDLFRAGFMKSARRTKVLTAFVPARQTINSTQFLHHRAGEANGRFAEWLICALKLTKKSFA
ncbi:hypothetical protein [Sphingobium sp. B8D3D]|uniref:hypothetical protein n=1 Tax=Sphingobium sp. B8D3D TaxID=2940587 RepID=UPI0022253203|nr:hypothetical protein [Sphingobium sp. B8D3D]MCW2416817.1 hypothetical protein [Sphingobium sp. B8D3A]